MKTSQEEVRKQLTVEMKTGQEEMKKDVAEVKA